MPETTTPTLAQERAEIREQFIHADAVECFLSCIDAIDDERMFSRSVLLGENGEVNLGSGRLGDLLWPSEADYDSPEGIITRSKSAAIITHIFETLASDEGRAFCVAEAAQWARKAELGDAA
jgi:hypothetical protein